MFVRQLVMRLWGRVASLLIPDHKQARVGKEYSYLRQRLHSYLLFLLAEAQRSGEITLP